ncbi:ankyrin repeat protein [Megavirus baoshan]|uniref:Ankyrin repeat protein n=1 Tax=Megavirus baoshan TaxID=2496520 RepID=A0A3Q8U8U3_9VIRU|nr:ankyrin repeat protein [Megavirus baoshan]AZL89886.1 ankyrin repeat protein [Megavirus baoshan]
MFFEIISNQKFFITNVSHILQYLSGSTSIIPIKCNHCDLKQLSLNKWIYKSNDRNNEKSNNIMDVLNIKTHIYLKNIGADYINQGHYIIKWICSKGLLDILKFMIDCGFNVLCKQSGALRYSAKYCQYDLLKYLINTKSNVEDKNNYALFYASKLGYYNIVKLLVYEYVSIYELNIDLVNIFSHAIILATDSGHLSIIKLLLKYGGKYNYQNFLALRRACRHGHDNIVKYILDISDKKDNYESAKCATIYGHLTTIKILEIYGTNLRDRNDELLTIASEKGHYIIVKFLISKGCNVNAYDNWSIRYAAANGYIKIIRYLIKNGADISALNYQSIKWASYNGHYQIVISLLQSESINDISKKDLYEAIDWALQRGHQEIMHLLLEKVE